MNFTLMVTSDLHGEYGRFRKIADEILRRKPDLLIDNGDFLQGSLLQAYCDRHPEYCHPMIQLANELRYDAAVLGNHEFNAPLEAVRDTLEKFDFPWISCNIGNFARPYIVKHIKGIKVVVLGATTQHTPLWDECGTTATLEFEPAFLAVQRWVQYIRQFEQPDCLIVSYHGGFAADPNGKWIFDDNTGENEAMEILQLDGVDLLITGHQHLCLQGELRGTPYIQPGSHGHYFAEVSLTKDGGRWSAQSRLIPILTEAPPPAEIQTWFSEAVGYIPFDLRYYGRLDVIRNGHSYINWFHEFQLVATNADLSITELFYRESGGFRGLVRRKDILENYPRNHLLLAVRLPGKAIADAIEQSAASLALNCNREIDYAAVVYPGTLQPYQYDFWGGLSYELDLTKPVGRRVCHIVVQGRPLDLNQTYTVAINSFRALGNEPFTMFRGAATVRVSSRTIPELLENYIRCHYPVVGPK